MQLSAKILVVALTITLHHGDDCVQAFTLRPSLLAGTTTTTTSNSRTELHVGSVEKNGLEVEFARTLVNGNGKVNGQATSVTTPGKEEQATRNYMRLLPDLDVSD